MFEIVIDASTALEVDYMTWRSYRGVRLLNGQPFTGPVLDASEPVNDNGRSRAERKVG